MVLHGLLQVKYEPQVTNYVIVLIISAFIHTGTLNITLSITDYIKNQRSQFIRIMLHMCSRSGAGLSKKGPMVLCGLKLFNTK